MCDFFIIPVFCGTWDQVRSLGPESMTCPRCHNNAIQTIKRRTWFTLYCVPVFPISRKKQLYHCDICRWEGIPVARVNVGQERPQSSGSRHRHGHRHRSQGQQSPSQPRQMPQPEQFQSEPYSQDDYEAPPPPYSPKAPENTKAPKKKRGKTRAAQEAAA
ncbi:hypothetical protein GQ54DRAFT_322217 [Martensiomyces pterosporus]|nr:hypothetical protein GQ54DRAFT_322217 [Martensiomyces pterosporus]